jgi:poly-beta-hydroxybutyrate-responsive repressor
LQGNASHGYDLIENLKEFNLTEVDPSVVYRNLRQMEEWGLVTSHWDTEGSGPSRRVYKITPQGKEFLRLSAEGLQNTKDRLDRFLKAYNQRFEPPSERESKDEDLG